MSRKTTNQKAWFSQATARKADASVFVEKSPPFLLLARQLRASFTNTRFIIMVRDPYAAYEGILRRRGDFAELNKDPRVVAADHLAACLEWQQRNVLEHGDISATFTYEELCAEPSDCVARIARVVPELGDLRLDEAIEVKGMYYEQLRDMNEEQIGRLTQEDLDIASSVFGRHQEVLDYFGYRLR